MNIDLFHFRMLSRIFCLGLLLALPDLPGLRAATSAKGETNSWQQREVTASAMAVALVPGLDELYLLDPLNRPLDKIRIRELLYGRPFVCTSFDGIAYFGIEDGVDELGQPKYKAIASTTVPSNVDKAGIIFVPNQILTGNTEDENNYLVRVFDNGLKAFPPASTFVINLLPTQIVMKIGDNKRVVSHGNVVLIDKVGQLDDYNMADVSFFYQRGDEWNILKQSKIRYLPNLRYTAVAYFDMRARRPTIVFVRDSGQMKLRARAQASVE